MGKVLLYCTVEHRRDDKTQGGQTLQVSTNETMRRHRRQVLQVSTEETIRHKGISATGEQRKVDETQGDRYYRGAQKRQ